MKRFNLEILMLCVIVALSLISCATTRKLEIYEQYYRASETLLDSLENQMHWMDATDPGPAYDNYINARKQLR